MMASKTLPMVFASKTFLPSPRKNHIAPSPNFSTDNVRFANCFSTSL